MAKTNGKVEIIKTEADRLITEGGRALSWHIRLGTGIPTPQVNYYMRKLVADGVYKEKKLGSYCIEYTPITD